MIYLRQIPSSFDYAITTVYFLVFPEISFLSSTSVWNKKTLILSFWGLLCLSRTQVTSQVKHRDGPSFWPLLDASMKTNQVNCRKSKSEKKSSKSIQYYGNDRTMLLKIKFIRLNLVSTNACKMYILVAFKSSK